MRLNLYSLILLVFLISPQLMIAVCDSDSQYHQYTSEQVIAETQFFVRGPTVNMVANDSATIFWRTESPTNATVWYGLNDSVIESVVNTTYATDHMTLIDELEMDSKYYYKVVSNNTESLIYHFRTAPPDGTEFKMIVIGDNRPASISYIQPDEFKQLAQMIIDEEPHLVVMTGDYVLDVNDDHEYNLAGWAAFTNVSDSIGHYAPIYGVLGNHDTGAKTGSLLLDYYFDAFVQYGEPSTYYSFDFAGVHFTILDTEELHLEGRITGDQYTWLVNDLQSTNCGIKYVFGHRPMYPLSHIGDSIDSNPAERAALQQLFEDHNVTAFICGHDHLFNRLTVNRLVHIISGGGGAPLYGTQWGGNYHHYVRIISSNSHVNMSTIRLDGVLTHNYQIPYNGPLEIELRAIFNGSSNQPGTLPEIYFSEIPIQMFFSWDSGENQTEVTVTPSSNGQHVLDVYALASDDVWYHERFVFTTVGGTTNPPPTIIDPLLIGGLAVAGIVIVVIVVVFKKRQ